VKYILNSCIKLVFSFILFSVCENHYVLILSFSACTQFYMYVSLHGLWIIFSCGWNWHIRSGPEILFTAWRA